MQTTTAISSSSFRLLLCQTLSAMRVMLCRAYDPADLDLGQPAAFLLGGQDGTFTLTDEGSSQFEAQLSISGVYA